MKLLKKILMFDPDLTNEQNILRLFYRLFTFVVPMGFVLWTLVIDKLLDKDVSIMAKWGCAGTFALIVLALVGVYLTKRAFKKHIEKVNDKLLVCTDDDKKKKLVEKKNIIKKREALFRNICLIAPFIIAYVITSLIEKSMISVRGGILAIIISLMIGLVFNYFYRSSVVKKGF